MIISKLSQFLPIIDWLPEYNKKTFFKDVIAGFTVAVLLVPQGMAYALLAGIPPIYGLYAGVIPLLLYAFFGTSRQLSVGPVALVSLLVMAGLSEIAEPFSQEYINLVILTALLAGIFQLIFGIFKLGFLVNFLSHPVLSGFTSAAAFIIAFSQVGNLFGIAQPRSNQIIPLLSNLIPALPQLNILTFTIGIGGLILMLGLKKWHRSIPYALITVVLSIVLVQTFNWDQIGVATIGAVPKGLPAFSLPLFDWESIKLVLPLSFTICLISFIESLAIAQVMEAQHKNYRIVPNQELIALGMTKIVGAFFQCLPTTGSFSRSAINSESGARTGVASIVTALLMVITLLFLTSLFYYLPKAILSAIIILSVIGLIDYKEAIRLWETDRSDFTTLAATFLITLLAGIQIGIMAGVILSLAIILYENSKPHYAILGQLPNTRKYRNVNRFPKAIQHPGLIIVRFDAQIYFANAMFLREMLEEIAEENENLQAIVLDMSSVHAIDSSGLHTLEELLEYFTNRNIALYLASAIGPVRDLLEKTNFTAKVGKEQNFMLVHDAVSYYKNRPTLNTTVEDKDS